MDLLLNSYTRSVSLCGHCDAAVTVHWYVTKTIPTAELRDGFVPSNTEISAMIDSISAAEVDVARCDEELSTLRVIVAQLERDRQAIQDDILTRKALLAPVRRLPPELLSHIFLLRLRSPDNMGKKHGARHANNRSLPVWLSSVCHRWRSVAMQTGELWAYHTIFFKRIRNIDKLYQFIQLSIGQSRNAPLIVEFHFDVYDRLSVGQRRIVELLAQQSHQWADVLFEFTPLDLLNILEQFDHRFPRLTHLEIRDRDLGAYQRVFERATGLGSLDLRHCVFPLPPTPTGSHRFALERLWEITVDFSVGLLNILGQCIRLTRLRIRFSDPKVDATIGYLTTPIRPATVIPRLSSLVLEGSWSTSSTAHQYINWFLQSIATPALRRLELYDACGKPDFALYSDLVERSHCMLRTFVIRARQRATNDEDMLKFFHSQKELKYLHLYRFHIPDAIIRSFTFGREPSMLPCLCHLALYEQVHEDVTKLMTNFIESPLCFNSDRTSLQSLQVSLRKQAEPSNLPQLRGRIKELRRTGLKIPLQFNGKSL